MPARPIIVHDELSMYGRYEGYNGSFGDNDNIAVAAVDLFFFTPPIYIEWVVYIACVWFPRVCVHALRVVS